MVPRAKAAESLPNGQKPRRTAEIRALPEICHRKRNTTRKGGVSLAEKKGFEPLRPFRGLHDFQSCALDQLGDFSITIFNFVTDRQRYYYSRESRKVKSLFIIFPILQIPVFGPSSAFSFIQKLHGLENPTRFL